MLLIGVRRFDREVLSPRMPYLLSRQTLISYLSRRIPPPATFRKQSERCRRLRVFDLETAPAEQSTPTVRCYRLGLRHFQAVGLFGCVKVRIGRLRPPFSSDLGIPDSIVHSKVYSVRRRQFCVLERQLRVS